MKNHIDTSVPSPVEKVQHTKGPWGIDKPFREEGIWISGPFGELVAKIHEIETSPEFHNLRKGEEEANGRLIAAAPDLLAALQAMLTIRGITTAANHEGLINCDILAKARAAIAKAINT